MKVHITTEENLVAAALKSGCTEDQLDHVARIIKDEFEQSAKLIYNQTLKEAGPDDLDVRLKLLPGNQAVAGFLSRESFPDYLVFGVFDIYIAWLIQHLDDDNNELHNTVLYELMHSVDLKELRKGDNLIDPMRERIYEYIRNSSSNYPHEYHALFATLKFVNHYRAEGLAILCSSVLEKTPVFDNPVDYNEQLKQFTSLIVCLILKVSERSVQAFDLDNEFNSAYAFAASVMLQVLTIRKDISQEISDKIKEGMTNGQYHLTDEEIRVLILACRSLTLTEYIEGLIFSDRDGSALWPVRSLLELCTLFQNKAATDDAVSFETLLDQTQNISEETFNETIQHVIDTVLTPKELKKRYKDYQHSMDVEMSPLKPKVDLLYSEFAKYPDGEGNWLSTWARHLFDRQPVSPDDNKKVLIQWALSYFFQTSDMISDQIPVYGYVDDMVVMDTALRILQLEA